MNELIQDIAFAWRNALKQPASALLIVLTLALGIGANSAMFSMAWHVLLAPLPYEDGERLVKIEQDFSDEGRQDAVWSLPAFQDFQEQAEAFSHLFGYMQQSLTLVGQDEPDMVLAGVVSANFFDALGIRPMLGRDFINHEDSEGAAPVMLLSHDFWLSKFGADPGVLGNSLELNGVILTVIGVLPEMPSYPHYNHVWITQSGNPYVVKLPSSRRENRGLTWFEHVFGKMRDGVNLEASNREADTIVRRLVEADPDSYSEDYSIEAGYLKDEMVGEPDTTFLLLMALAFLVVLIASANIANLNLARMAIRNQELAIREALGADPVRIARQLLTESLLFSLAGGILGLLIAYSGLNLLADFASGYTSLSGEIEMDVSVLLFTLTVSLLTGVLSGAASAFSRRDINRALKEGGDKVTASSAGARRRQVLLGLQFTLSFVVLSTSAMILLSLYRLNSQDLGYDPERVLAVSMSLNIDLDGDPAQFPRQIRSFGMSLLKEASAAPGVAEAGLFSGRPLLQEFFYNPTPVSFDLESDPDSRLEAIFHGASGGFFRAMDIPLLSGRSFTESDDENAPRVAMVNANFANRYFPSGDVIGQRIRFPWEPEWWTVVGVIDNIRSTQLNRMEGETVYYNFQQFPGDVMNLYVKSAADPDALSNVISDIVYRIDPRQSISSIQPLNDIKTEWLAPTRLRAILISLFGLLAMVVTLSGVIGVVSCNISQRIREIGVHMAIGANPADIIGMFIRQGLKVYFLGLLLGAALMLVGAPMIQPLLYETSATDAGIYLASALVLTLAVLIAMYVPVRKASEMSPVAALHIE